MAASLQPYLKAIRVTLESVLSLRNFESQFVERHNKPEVELEKSKMLLRPLIVSRNEREKVLIESSIDSVRISIAIKQADDLERLLCKRFIRFLVQHANDLLILRKKAIKGYDLTFLLLNEHLDIITSESIISFITQFMEDIDREISQLKLTVNSRTRVCAEEFLKQFN